MTRGQPTRLSHGVEEKTETGRRRRHSREGVVLSDGADVWERTWALRERKGCIIEKKVWA